MKWGMSNFFHILNCHNGDSIFNILTYLNYSVANRRCRFNKVDNEFRVPILWNHPHFRLLVPRLHFHVAPIRFRCASTLALRMATSSFNFGSGVS